MPTLPILPLILGAIAIWLARQRHERVLWLLATVSALAAWVFSLAYGAVLPTTASLSVWRPIDLFASRLELVLDPIGWRFVYSTATLLLAVLLTGIARPGEAKPWGRAMMLGYTGLAMMAMLAGNLLTVATVWALMDVLLFLFLLGIVGRGDPVQGLVTRLAIDATSVALVVAAVVADRAAGGNTTLTGGMPSATAAGLLSMAVLLRIGLLPPHFNLPPLPGIRIGVGTLVRLLPPAAALCILGRALNPGVPYPLVPWLRAAGAAGVVVGGLRWALERGPLAGRRFLVLGLLGMGVLASSLPSVSVGTVLAAAGALLLLAGGVVSLAEVHTPAHRGWIAAGAVLLAGMPWTPGGRMATALGAAMQDSGTWWVIMLAVAGSTALTFGASRSLRAPSTPWPSGESLVRTVYGMGLALPTLTALGLGIWTSGSASVPGVTVFLLSAGLGIALFWTTRRKAGDRPSRWERLAPLLDLAPVYRWMWGGYRRLMRLVRALARVLEGEGAMLWTYVVLVLVILSLR